MAKLRCESLPERALIPAFIFFFQMLYPFSWVNDRRRTTAAAAGGCMLVRRDALQAAGGFEAIRGSIIDDCAMARILKRRGPIRLGLSERVVSIRPYSTIGEIRRMVVRSAYAQLRYSPLLLALAVAGLTLVFVAPVLATIFGHGAAQIFGLSGVGHHGGCFSADPSVLSADAVLGTVAAGDSGRLHGIHVGLRLSVASRTWRSLERPRARACDRGPMTNASDCDPERPIGKRISPLRRCSFARNTVGQFWRSIISCAPPTMSPTTRR